MMKKERYSDPELELIRIFGSVITDSTEFDPDADVDDTGGNGGLGPV